jgi:L,D-peptidoglycan transpeptidase YkuD (ErfK/YbiS/YcfS/YnhG family)
MKKLFAFLLTAYIFTTVTIIPQSEVGTDIGLTSLFNELYSINGSSQIIVVTNEKESQFKATVEAYEKTTAGWTKSLPSMNAVIGKNGFPRLRRKETLRHLQEYSVLEQLLECLIHLLLQSFLIKVQQQGITG